MAGAYFIQDAQRNTVEYGCGQGLIYEMLRKQGTQRVLTGIGAHLNICLRSL